MIITDRAARVGEVGETYSQRKNQLRKEVDFYTHRVGKERMRRCEEMTEIFREIAILLPINF